MSLRRQIIVNLGSSRVTVAVLSWNSDVLELKEVYFKSINSNPENQSNWVSHAGKALKSICRENKIRGSVQVVLPSGQLLSKTLRVPKVEEIKQREVVSYELSQKMPFSLESMIWDYQIIDDDGIEQEILAFAVKPNFIDSICQILLQSHLTTTHICAGTILENEILSQSETLNNYSELLLINIGAHSTNLLFSSNQGYLARNINFGGNNFSIGLSEAFGLSFDKAEELKINFSEGRLRINSDDPASEAFNSVANNYNNKFAQEISRSLVTYKRLKKGKYPQVIILTGRAAKDIQLVEFLSSSLDIPVVTFDASEHVSSSEFEKSDFQDEFNFSLSEVLGFAQLGRVGRKITPTINLLPSRIRKSLEFKKKKIWLFTTAILFALFPIPFLITNIFIEREEKIKLISKTKLLKEKENEISLLEDKKYDLKVYQSINSDGFEYLSNFISKSKILYFQSRFINDVQNVVLSGDIKNTWIDSIQFIEPASVLGINRASKSIKNNTVVEIKGRYLVSLPESTSKTSNVEERQERLIELNSEIQDNLTGSLLNVPTVNKLFKKIFATDGKGDLFRRYYTYFEIHAQLDFRND